jgi:phospholipase/carboxylesterase
MAMSELYGHVIEALRIFEKVQRRFHPLNLLDLHEMLMPMQELLEQDLHRSQSGLGSEAGQAVCDVLERAAEEIIRAVYLITPSDDIQQGMMNVLRAGRKVCRVQENLYPFRHEYEAINEFFLEEAVRGRIFKTNYSLKRSRVQVGIRHTGLEDNPYARSGLSLYVPESYDDSRAWPMVVALHGGFGHGRDFLWTWLREARSRGFILLAPTSQGTTWSISRPEEDLDHLLNTCEDLVARYRIDADRIMITGISDGATFALICGLRTLSPFTAVAVVSGVLAPMDLSAAQGRRIFWVHGAHDWMFPVSRAVSGCKALSASGADVTLRIIPDLAHAYPREENNAILKWFDPSLCSIES